MSRREGGGEVVLAVDELPPVVAADGDERGAAEDEEEVDPGERPLGMPSHAQAESGGHDGEEGDGNAEPAVPEENLGGASAEEVRLGICPAEGGGEHRADRPDPKADGDRVPRRITAAEDADEFE